jgi:hypothetical protein
MRIPFARAIAVASITALASSNMLPAAAAQTTSGTLIGGVQERTRKGISQTVVRAINLDTGSKRATRTDDSGRYGLFNMPPGRYTIIAAHEGFNTVTINQFPIKFNYKNIIELPNIILVKSTLTGKVVDRADSGLLNASITLSGPRRSLYQAVTGFDGRYTLPDVSPGQYVVTASWKGRRSSGSRTVPVSVTAEYVSAPSIKIEEAIAEEPDPAPQTSPSTQLEGEKTAALVDKTDAARGGNIGEEKLRSLPVGGATIMRSFDEFALLLPGVAPPPYTPGVRGPGVGFGIGSAGEFSVNGMRARSNNFTIDGSDNNDPDVGVRRQGFVALVPQSLESIKEMSVSTMLWDAELNRDLGSQINAVSRYGSNGYHGQVYGFLSDSRLNARNFFDYNGGPSGGKDTFTRSQEGFVLGGPIVQDRTQFFTSFEHDRLSASQEQHFATPGVADRRFLGLPQFGVLKPFASALPNLVFNTTLGATPLGRNILSFYPLPNDPGGPYGPNTFTQVLPADGSGNIFSTRITHQFAENYQLAVRYNFTDDNRLIPSVNRAIDSTIDSEARTQNLSVIFDNALKQTAFNQIRFSFGRTRLGFHETAGNPFLFSSSSVSRVGLPTGGSDLLTSSTGPLGEVVAQPFSPVGIDVFTIPQNRVNNALQVADSVSWTLGAHLLKFGGDIRHNQFNSLQDRNYRPVVEYGYALLSPGDLRQTTDPNNPLAFKPNPGNPQLISGAQLATIGVASSFFQTITNGTPNSLIGLRETELNFFVNDNWRLRPNFNIDYGLRYQYNPAPSEVNRRIENALTLTNLPAAGGSAIDTPERTARFNAALNAYTQALGKRTSIYDASTKDFAPHLGFAWDPWSNGNLSVRGGYGIYYDAILGAVVTQSRNVFPNEIPVNVDPSLLAFDVFVLNNPAFLQIQTGRQGRGVTPVPLIRPGTTNQLGGSAQDFAPLVGQLFLQNQLGGGLAFTLPEKHLRSPYAQQWNLTVEGRLFQDFFLSAAYVGTKGTALTRLTTPNLGPDVTAAIPLAVTFNSQPLGAPIIVTNSQAGLSRAPQRPTPALGAYQIFEDSASSSYHALQLEARKRYSRGYEFSFAYTWSHAIDDVSDVFPIAGAPILPQDSNNLRLERANANFDIRQHFAASFIWDLPLYRGQSTGVGRWLGGWQLSSVFQAHSGQPFTLLLPFDANFDGNLTDRPSTTQGLAFSNSHGPQRVSVLPGHDVSSFVVPGQDGFVGRNSARGDSFINLDLALGKSFRFTERQSLDFRFEVFNSLNRANFGLPIGLLGSPAFGAAVETANPARLVQFALEYKF